jgi:hypothetical protein
VFEHVGTAGWVTPSNYEAMEADGFAGVGVGAPADVAALRADLAAYDPSLGWQGRELVRSRHDARAHVGRLVELASEIAPAPWRVDDQQLEALAALARVNLLMAEVAYGRMIQTQLLGQEVARLGRQVADLAAVLEEIDADRAEKISEIEHLRRWSASL